MLDVHGVLILVEIKDFLGEYPKHYATVPVANDGREKRRAFQAVSNATREIIFGEKYDFRTAIITGTNGKGSTGSILSTLITENGLKVGTISSPAMREDCTDMIKVNGNPIPPPVLMAYLEKAEDKLAHLKGNQSLTHYMPLCVAAYDYFRDQQVDVVVAETAIGGLYDPTVPFSPDVCIFTNITKEHQDVLGDSLDKVARHKSRVIGQGARVILGEEITDPLAEIISSYAERKRATVNRVDQGLVTSSGIIYDRENIKIFNGGKFCPTYQHPNLRLAAEAFLALDIPRTKEIAINLDRPPVGIFPENRFEFRQRNGVTYLFDSAHNEDSYLKLAQSLQGRFKPEELSFFKGASTQESLDDFLNILQPHRVTFVSGYHPRVFAQEGFINLKDVDFEAHEKLTGSGVIVICGIFLAPKVKELLFAEDAQFTHLLEAKRDASFLPKLQQG